MAVASQSFSIREYALKMRSVDMAKCWPWEMGEYSDDGNKLPPITVKKFRWWADEVALLTSKPHHQDQHKEEIKAKAPKKRSIVDIIAVAPHHQVDDDDDASQGTQFSAMDVCLNKNISGKNKKKKKKKITSLKENKPLINHNNIKFKKRKSRKNSEANTLTNPSIANKEKPQKHQLQSTGLSYSKGFTSDIFNAVPIHKKKPRLKSSVMQKRNKNCQSSKLFMKHQKLVFPVCGILKKHNNVISAPNSTICNLQGSNQANQRGDRPSDRHVRFSDKDDILRPKRKRLSSIGCPKSQNICSSYDTSFTASLVKNHAEERGKDLATVEVTGSDEDDSYWTENETGVQPISESQLPDICHQANISNFLRPHTICQELFPDRYVTLNQVATHAEDLRSFEQDYRAASDDPSYTCNLGIGSVQKEGYKPNVNTQLGGGFSSVTNTDGMVIDNFGDPIAGVTARLGMEKAFPQISSSSFRVNGNTNGRLPYHSQATQQNSNGHALQYQPYCPVPTKELMGGIYSSTDWRQRNITCRGQIITEDFFGLPLNSQGELVRLNSSGKDGFSQVMRPSTVMGSSRCLAEDDNVLPNCTGKQLSERRTPLKDQLKLFPLESCVEENVNLPVQSNGDVQLLGSVSADNHYVYPPPESERDMVKISGTERKQLDQVQCHTGFTNIHLQGNHDHLSQHGTQPTMRLMGKEFIVGKSGEDLEGFEDGKVWMDKQIITEHHAVHTATDNALIKRKFQQDLIVHPVSSKGRPAVDCIPEIQINQASHCVLQMRPQEFRLSHPYLNCQTNILHQNGCGTINRIPNSQYHHCSPPAVSPNRSPTLQEPFIAGYESSVLKSQVPTLAPMAHYTCQNTSASFSQLKAKQKQPYATKSLLEFPFLYPECGEHAKLSCFQSFPKSQPPWLLNATQQKETSLGSFQADYDAGSYHPCTIAGANRQDVPPVHCRPEVSYASNLLSSHSSMQNLSGPITLGYPPFMPVRPRRIPTSATYNSYGERMKSNDCAKDANSGKKTKKRPATKADDSRKPSKIPNLEIQGDIIGATSLNAIGNFGSDIYLSRESLELDSNRERASNLGCCQNDTQEDGPGTGTESFKMDLVARSGPIKLSAGTKHILKPCQNTDQCNLKPTRSTVPYAVACSSGQKF